MVQCRKDTHPTLWVLAQQHLSQHQIFRRYKAALGRIGRVAAVTSKFWTVHSPFTLGSATGAMNGRHRCAVIIVLVINFIAFNVAAVVVFVISRDKHALTWVKPEHEIIIPTYGDYSSFYLTNIENNDWSRPYITYCTFIIKLHLGLYSSTDNSNSMNISLFSSLIVIQRRALPLRSTFHCQSTTETNRRDMTRTS